MKKFLTNKKIIASLMLFALTTNHIECSNARGDRNKATQNYPSEVEGIPYRAAGKLGTKQFAGRSDEYTNFEIKKPTSSQKITSLGTAVIVSAIAYGAYQQINQLAEKSIPAAATTLTNSIIFDIDGVLTKTNKLRAFYEIDINNDLEGILNKPVSLLYMKDQRQLPSEKVLFDALSGVPAVSSYTSYNNGLQMPQIMVDWQTNAQDPSKIKQAITNHLTTANLPESQKNWALQSALLMTDPERFIASRTEIQENIALLQELKNKGYKLYILSNWDAQSFPLFQKTFSDIFVSKKRLHVHGSDYDDYAIIENGSMFDGIMISGHAGIVKPETILFEKCLKDFNLNPHLTVFIDDEPANIAAATKLGIKTVHANPDNPQAVRENLIDLLTK